MKRFVTSILSLLIASSALAAPGKQIRRSSRKIADRYIVVFTPDVASRDAEAVADDLVRAHNVRKDHQFQHTIKGFSAIMNEQRAVAMLNHPKVDYIEEDGQVTATAVQSSATWGIDRTDQRDLPLSGTYTYNYDGTGVRAYIIDTGVKIGHAEFGSRRVSGFDAVTSGGSADDCNGHGTHVAGTVGGTTYGVAKNVTIVPIRVLDCAGSGTNSGVIAGVDWVTNDHAAGVKAVANMSLGGGASTALDDAVRVSIADGVTYALASGNDNLDACNSSPARVAEGITVNSSTSTDARSSFSNWGTCTDIFAPGSSITSAWYTSTTATNTISGTSMATPHVCGVAALVQHQFGYLSPADTWIKIRDNATLNKVTSPGTGSANRLLHSIFGTTTPAPSISSFSPTSGGVGTSVTITGSNFTGASSVKFNGQAASSFTVNSASQITASVANCSSSGAISVTTAGGTASSSTSFSVTGCTTPPPPPPQTVLTNGVAVTGLSASTGVWKHFIISVPTGQSKLDIVQSGGTGDADLYVKFGSQPTSTSYTYRPYLSGNNETVSVTNPSAGSWYISIYAYSSYASVSLKATYSTTTTPTCTTTTGTLSTVGANAYSPSSSGYSSAVSGSHTGKLTGPSTADFDLYLEKWNGSTWAVVASGEGTTSTENITYSGTSGSYRWRIKAYSGTGTWNLCSTKP